MPVKYSEKVNFIVIDISIDISIFGHRRSRPIRRTIKLLGDRVSIPLSGRQLAGPLFCHFGHLLFTQVGYIYKCSGTNSIRADHVEHPSTSMSRLQVSPRREVFHTLLIYSSYYERIYK